jgi:beta-glucanase (GH16 family)
LSISNIALLWPVANVWPPEVDFYEDYGGTRSTFMATLHAGPNGNDSVLVQHRRAIDDTRWHTVGVEWTPTTISYTVDGATWEVVPSGAVPGGGHWPDQPMFLSIQSQNVGPAQPSGPIETMTVAWVAIYAPAA